MAGTVTVGSVQGWYATLHAPPLTPPHWLFGPVWSLLYVMMAVAAWMVWREADVRWLHYKALRSWGWQLCINALWPPVFFGAHLLLPGLFVIILLFAAVAYTIYRFWPLQRMAAWMLAPYLAWVGFALYLNAGFWWLNH